MAFSSTPFSSKEINATLNLLLENTSESTKNKHRIEALDGLRAIACFMVLIAHFGIPITWQSYSLGFVRKILPGELGVMIFFCLSSFLITLLLVNEYEVTRKIDIIKFFTKRALRIWPIYFFIIFFTLIHSYFVSIPQNEIIKEYWKYLFFIANWYDIKHDFAILWSVCVEEQFYIVLPIIAAFAFKSHKRGIYIIITCLVIGFIWRIFYRYHPYPGNFRNDLYYLTPTYIDCFTYASLSAWLYKNKIELFYALKINSRIFASIIIFGLITCCYVVKRKLWWEPATGITIFSYSIMPIGICLLIVHFSLKAANNFGYFLGSNFMKNLGVLSFGIYLWHLFAVHNIMFNQVSIMKFDLVQPNELYYLLLFIEYCAVCVLLAALSFQLIELPFLRLRNSIYSEKFSNHRVRWQLPIKKIIFSCSLMIIFILCIFYLKNLF